MIRGIESGRIFGDEAGRILPPGWIRVRRKPVLAFMINRAGLQVSRGLAGWARYKSESSTASPLKGERVKAAADRYEFKPNQVLDLR